MLRFIVLCAYIAIHSVAFSTLDGSSTICSSGRSRLQLHVPPVHHTNHHGNIATTTSPSNIPFVVTKPPTITARLLATSGGDIDSDTTTTSTPALKHRLFAEALGTFLIVHLGCGVVCASLFHGAQTGLWQIAAAWSLAVALAIYTTASVSGAHLNPAVTVAMATVRQFSPKEVAPYVLAQLTGAFGGAAWNLCLFRESIAAWEATAGIVRKTAAGVASASAFGEYWSVSSWFPALLAETSGTFVLALVVFALTHEKNDAVSPALVPAVIGGTVGALISVLAPLTQAGFNPARDFGPRLVAWWLGGWSRAVALQGWWVYVVGPVLGAVLGGLVVDKILFAGNGEDELEEWRTNYSRT